MADPSSFGTLAVVAGSFAGPALAWLLKQAQETVIPGVVSNWAHQLAEVARTKGIAAFVGQMSEGKLPANHDIALASRSALADALSWMAREMALEPSPQSRSSLLAAARGGVPVAADLLLPPENRDWIEGLRDLARDDEKLLELDHRHLNGAEVEKLLKTVTDTDIAAELHARVRGWLDKHLAKAGSPPEQLDDFLDRGWLLPDGKSRLTLYQAWCWYFRESIKHRPEAFNSFVSTALADLLGARAEPVDVAEVFRVHLEGPLGKLLDVTAATLQISQTIDATTQRSEGDVKAIRRKLGMDAEMGADFDTLESLLEQEVLEPAQQSLLAFLCARDGASPLDSKTIQAAMAAPVTGLRGYLLHLYAQACRAQGTAVWLDSGEIRLDTDFIDLQLLVQPHVDNSPEQRFDSLSDLLDPPAAVDAWVLVGDAGGGKTTLLRHHAMQHARRLLRSLAEAGKGPQELCIWLRLSAYRRERIGNDLRWPDCEQWLQAQWASHAAGAALPSLTWLRKHFRLRFLLDGINEIEPGIDPAIRQQAMLRFAEWLHAYRNAQPAPVFSVRRHDRGAALLNVDGLTVRQVDLVRWSPERIEEFCRHRRASDGALWAKLKADPALLALCQVPFNLSAQCALHDEGYFADSRADLFLGLLWLSLRRALKKKDLSEAGLLTSLDQNKIHDRRHWKLHRRVLPAEGTLLRGLEQQALDMAHEVEVSYDEAALFSWPDFNRRAWLAAVQAIGVAEVRTDDTGDQFAFAHQLWQSFFTARGLVEHPEPLIELMASPHKSPDITNWEEAVKLAVQLSHRPDEMVDRLAGIDLALCGRAAAGCLSRLPADLATRLRVALLERSRDAAVELRSRMEAADALGFMGDVVRYERCGGPGTASAPHLLPRRESGWIHVPGGLYAIGSRKGQPGADADESGPDGEPVPVELRPFDVAFAPVTNAEFALFIQDGGYENDRWWPGEMPGRWRRGELRDDGGREWQMRRHAALVKDFDVAMNRFFFRRTPKNLEFARSFSALSHEEALAKVDSWYPYSGKPPAFMDVANFSNPLQPVVGVSLFEAEAYCRWLSAQAGVRLRLPTESEWEAAARGRPPRSWPWGEHEPALESFNADALHLLRTSPIGVFPLGDTPEGMVDVAGNVWEWTTSEYTPEGLRAECVNTAAAPETLRAVRGGCHDFVPDQCRPAYRFKCHPLLRNEVVGFRIVCE